MPDWLSVPLSPGVAMYTRWRTGTDSRGARGLFCALTYVIADTTATAHVATNTAVLRSCMAAPVFVQDEISNPTSISVPPRGPACRRAAHRDNGRALRQADGIIAHRDGRELAKTGVAAHCAAEGDLAAPTTSRPEPV